MILYGGSIMKEVPGSKTSSTLLGRLKNLADVQAWNEFVQRYSPRIYRWCRQKGLQDADACDVTQAVLTRLVRRLQTFVYDPGQGFHHWLATVTRHAWVDFLNSRPVDRASGKSEVQDQLFQIAAGDDLAGALEEEHRNELLSEAMARVRARVEPTTWEIYCLLTGEKQPSEAVARQFHMTVNAVYRVKNRVQTMLREEVRKLDQVH